MNRASGQRRMSRPKILPQKRAKVSRGGRGMRFCAYHSHSKLVRVVFMPVYNCFCAHFTAAFCPYGEARIEFGLLLFSIVRFWEVILRKGG